VGDFAAVLLLELLCCALYLLRQPRAVLPLGSKQTFQLPLLLQQMRAQL
jgi:hypothetical protein